MIAGLDATNFWIQFIAGIVVVVGGLWGVAELGMKVLVWRDTRKVGRAVIIDRLERIEAQYRNNGGSSMRDSVDRIERSISDLRVDVTRLDRALERHMGLHEGLDL